MSGKVMSLVYTSSLTDLCEVNSSFDSAVLRIAYAGNNRKMTSISRETFDRCINSIYNCPIVCNYDRDTDTLGGHDVELVSTNDGGMKLVNMTQPVGVIPQNARVFWQTVEEEDGTHRDYLCADALIWKRQEAYSKIKRDGITAQSMEITVKDGQNIDGIYHIYDFEFTAFALIGVTPCFESASLNFADDVATLQFSKMMSDMKKDLAFTFSNGDDQKYIQKNTTEGGRESLDKNALIEKYGIDVSTLDFNIDDFSVEELEAKFSEMANKDNPTPDDKQFALNSNIAEEIDRAFSAVTVQKEWGESPRYYMADYDSELSEAYCWDTTDWLLYGFTYAMDGDAVKIDFDSKKRKKYVIADFDEGETQNSPFAPVYDLVTKAYDGEVGKAKELEQKYQVATETINTQNTELETLRKFKLDSEANAAQDAKKAEIKGVFDNFTDLAGIEAFDRLMDECEKDCMKYDATELEEKCYAIKGRYAMNTVTFSAEQPNGKIIIEKNQVVNDPYNGVFEEFGILKTN